MRGAQLVTVDPFPTGTGGCVEEQNNKISGSVTPENDAFWCIFVFVFHAEELNKKVGGSYKPR